MIHPRRPASDVVQQVRLDESAPGRVRMLLEPFRTEIPPEPFEDLRLAMTELVAHCVRDKAFGDDVRVHVRRAEEVVEVIVSRPPDSSVVPAMMDDLGNAAAIGFRLVDALVQQWGVRDDGDRLTVWLRVATR